jgi:hypothetical protein
LFPKNVRSGASLAAFVLLCCAAFAARAGETTEVKTEVSVDQGYDSNIFYTTTDPKGSATTTIRPSLSIENNGTLGHADLYGYLSDHIFWSESKLTGVDRGVGGDLSRLILPRTTLFGNGSYQRFASHQEIRGSPTVTTTGGTGGVPGETIVQPGQLIEGAAPDLDVAQGVAGVRQQLTPRTKLELSGGPFSINYLNQNNAGFNSFRDRSGWFGDLTLTHTLTPLDQLTASLSANSTDLSNIVGATVPVNDPFDPHTVGLNTGDTTSDLQSLTFGWTRNWTELWSTTIAIGGRRLHTRTTNALRPLTRLAFTSGGVDPFVDYVPEEFSDTGPGVVGEFSLKRTLPRGEVALSYSRETRTTSSLFASDVNVDTVTFGWVHRLGSLVTFSLTGSWEHDESVNNNTQFFPASYIQGSFNPITGPQYTCLTGSLVTSGSGPGETGQCQISSRSALHSDSWIGMARVDWQLRKRLVTFGYLRYGDRNGDVQLYGQNYQKFNVGVGFRYDYSLGF